MFDFPNLRTLNVTVDVSADVKAILNSHTLKLNQIMSALEDLQAQVATLKTQATNLQTSLDAEQQQIADLLASNAAVVTDLNNQIAALNQQIADGATAAQLQEVTSGISETVTQLATTQSDLENTV